MADEVIHESARLRVRRARPEDSPALCELLRRVHLRGALDVTQERDPDFFALLELHQGVHDVWVGEDPADGRLGGVGTVVVRPGWVDGIETRVGYLADLRALPGFRGVRELPRAYERALEVARQRHGAELFHTVIFDENRVARRALVERRGQGRRAGQPTYRVMTPFDMTSVQLTLERPGPARRGRAVTRACDADLEPLVAFLAARARRRPMGDLLTPERFRARLALWPGLSLESFLIARDAAGRIVGAAAPWDSGALKRTRVLGYHGNMRWTKTGFDLAARALGFTRLPDPGECFRFEFLSHLEVEDDDPGVLADLLRVACGEARPRGLHFVSAMIPRGSSLARAFRGHVVNRTAMTVYSVTPADGPFAERDFATLHPGFEMALS
jgi:hypothetical protein